MRSCHSTARSPGSPSPAPACCSRPGNTRSPSQSRSSWRTCPSCIPSSSWSPQSAPQGSSTVGPSGLHARIISPILKGPEGGLFIRPSAGGLPAASQLLNMEERNPSPGPGGQALSTFSRPRRGGATACSAYLLKHMVEENCCSISGQQ